MTHSSDIRPTATTSRLYDITDTTHLCDEIGSLRAEVAELNQTLRTLEDLLAMNEGDVFEGDLYRVALTRNPVTRTVNWKAIAAKFNPTRQLVQAHTRTTTGERPRFRVSARKTDK